jgi:hypothetical protein
MPGPPLPPPASKRKLPAKAEEAAASSSSAPQDGALLATLGKELLPLGAGLTPDVLGRGTFSIVYRAIVGGNAAAAVKCLHALYSGSFYRTEAALAAEAAEAGGGLPVLSLAALPVAPVVVTPHVQARSFAALVRWGSLEDARRYMRALLRDLEVVHACASLALFSGALFRLLPHGAASQPEHLKPRLLLLLSQPQAPCT